MRYLFLIPAVAMSMVQAAPVSSHRFDNDGHSIEVEVFRPESGRNLPAIIFLHGSDGFSYNGSSYRHSASTLADHGFAVFLVHYFERTGTRWANLEVITAQFLTWIRTVADAITFAQAYPGVDKEKIGILGTSLGASLGMMAASQDPRVTAVADFCGLIPEVALPLVQRMPPTLILHGAADPVVPVEEAYKLEQLLTARGVEVEARIFPGQGHVFTGAAAAESLARTVAFFRTNLTRG
jgi:carboxymethylenebutenolidase